MNMKIEKLNDNQIRCTLTRADLAARQLQLSELAYGTEKAKSLFHDMMQQAAFEFGFEAEDIPLMIEAIPASSDSIVLIITKVEDPEELDTRFSKFSPSPGGDWDSKKNEAPDKLDGAETLLDLLGKVKEKIGTQEETSGEDTKEVQKTSLRLFSFATMDSVIQAARLLSGMYNGSNTLYKDHGEDVYILALTQSDHTTNDFNRICNMLSEYGSLEKASGATLAFLEEHCEILISADAVQKLAVI
ncbi:negative regulator of genetic competence (MecA) [[Clostridium] hylemonae DSM 15053]|uniref:Negative regulator of genetic competence (MecA) n=2 Tax=[Clostridium] hylemonae TaxID=89153 RepID=C0C218_9FIRM|nr:negative regulator of genetic competence (MecA) [[Clostridium] hylemonae DSM 15053]QEK19556.1 Adapter protein MecA 2 [[Clostridium] hylemonae DSM 15053]